MNKGVKILSLCALIFKVLAWISAVFFIIVSLIVLFGAGGDTPRAASLVFLIGGGIYFLVLFSASELIKLVIAIFNKVEKIDTLLEGKPSV